MKTASYEPNVGLCRKTSQPLPLKTNQMLPLAHKNGLVTLTKRYIHKEKKSSKEILNRQAGMLGGTMFPGLLQQTNANQLSI